MKKTTTNGKLRCPPNIVEQAKIIPVGRIKQVEFDNLPPEQKTLHRLQLENKTHCNRARRRNKLPAALSVDNVFADFKLGTKFHREGDPDNYYFELRRKVNSGFTPETIASVPQNKVIDPELTRPDTLKGTLYLLNRQTGEEIFHYTVPPAFNLV